MWTICWKSKEHGDNWDQAKTREDAINIANTLVREGEVDENDILIYPPSAEHLLIQYKNLENDISKLADTAERNLKRCRCGHGFFIVQHKGNYNILIDVNNQSVQAPVLNEKEPPSGPYICANCGAEYDELEALYRFRTVRFHHDDSGLCTTTFKVVGEDQYFNRSDDGCWYTVYPSNGYWENCSPVKRDIIFRIVNNKGELLFSESNGFSKRSFTPVSVFLRKTADTYAKEHGLVSHDEWKQYMTNCPEYEQYKGYRDNWLYYEAKETEAKVLGSFNYMDFDCNIIEYKGKHNVSGLEYLSYRLQSSDGGSMGICGYRLLRGDS